MSQFEIPQGLLARCAEQPEVCKRVIAKYVEQMQIDVDEISTIIVDDALTVARLAHRIKGASANVEAEALRNAAERIEKLAIKQELEAAKPIFSELEKYWNAYQSETAEFLSQA